MMYNKTFPDKPESSYKHVTPTGPSCKFNEGVSCSTVDCHGKPTHRNCDGCGWNPVVACQRKHDIMVTLGIIPDRRKENDHG